MHTCRGRPLYKGPQNKTPRCSDPLRPSWVGIHGSRDCGLSELPLWVSSPVRFCLIPAKPCFGSTARPLCSPTRRVASRTARICAPKGPLDGREHGGTRAVNSVNAWMLSARIKQITLWRGDLAAEGTGRRSVGPRTNVASLPVPEKRRSLLRWIVQRRNGKTGSSNRPRTARNSALARGA